MRVQILIALGFALAVALAFPASAANYGRRLGGHSASGDWIDMPAAHTGGTVTHPHQFTVVVTGRPKPGYLCTSNPRSHCDRVHAFWDVACRRPGVLRSRTGAADGRPPLAAHPRFPLSHPQRCHIEASGSLAYGAGGRVAVTVYYRT